MAADTLLLDLDGTVWNSRAWYADAIARLSDGSAAEIAVELEAGANVARIARQCGVSNARLAREAREDGASVEIYDGVFETLERLRARSTPIGVVSNLPGWLVGPLLESTGVGGHVAATATPRAGVPAKPQPHGIKRVLDELGRPTAGAWFVGDGTADAGAAAAAGVPFAWVSYGYDAEAPAGTARVLARFGDVLDL
ncbi:MAG: HAD hydrolase-like protein [Gammaproteobacteria bacterium]|nr:HAD hydrolase-like protein [Gammaproteobacteria bacterium]